MLTWFSEKAKWLIYVFIGLIAIALLSMDFMSLQWNNIPAVATWGKKEIPVDQFDASYKQAYDGKNDLSETEKAALREQLLQGMVSSRLLEEELDANKIVVSDSEMVLRLSAMLESDPRSWIPNPEILKQFMDESGKLDQAKFRQAMAEGMKQGSPLFRYMEAQIRSQAAEQHLQQLVLGGFHPTNLESKFLAAYAPVKSKLQILTALVDSFPATADENVYKAILAKATPESLLVREDMASYEAVVVPNAPSAEDINLAKENADSAYARLKEGQSFADVSYNWSEDSVARADSGRLGSWVSLDKWVPEFASAVQTLDSGAVSAPFKTRFGWHVVLCEGKKTDSTGKTTYKLRHILTKITIGSDTHKQIQDKLDAVRSAVLNGQTLAAAAQEQGLKVEQIAWTPVSKLGDFGYISGLANYAYPTVPVAGLQKIWNWSGSVKKDREAVSPVLRGDKVFAIAVVKDFRAKGDTSRGAFEARARLTAARQAQLASAAQFLNAQKAQLGTLSAQDLAKQYVGKLFADTLPMQMSMADWHALAEMPSAEFGKALTDTSIWSAPFAAAQGGVLSIAKPTSVTASDATAIQAALMGQYWRTPTAGKEHPAYTDWKRSLWNKNSVKTYLEQQYKGEEL